MHVLQVKKNLWTLLERESPSEEIAKGDSVGSQLAIYQLPRCRLSIVYIASIESLTIITFNSCYILSVCQWKLQILERKWRREENKLRKEVRERTPTGSSHSFLLRAVFSFLHVCVGFVLPVPDLLIIHGQYWETSALDSVAQSVVHHSVNRKVTCWIPGQGSCPGYGISPQSGHIWRATDWCFSPPLSPSLPLSLKISK